MTERETISALMARLRKMEVRLWTENGKLKYKSPSGRMTGAVLKEITGRKSEILEFLQHAAPHTSSFSQQIHPLPRSRSPHLSYAQERLWFLDQLEGSSSTYNIARAFQIDGHVNLSVFEQCVNELIRRHEVLRTGFRKSDEHVVQVIVPQLELRIAESDLRNLLEAEQQAAVERQIRETTDSPYDLSRSPLLRIKFLRLTEQRRILLLGMHHIISDGWSMGILIRELAALYDAFSTGKPSPLADLEIQYADFSTWQRQWLSGPVLAEHLSYWRETLAGAPEFLQLPADYTRPAERTYKGSTKALHLSHTLTEKLRALSRQSSTTLFMTLLGAYAVLLCRYARQEDIVIGSPIANRNRKEIEPLIGFFVNMLVLRTDLSGDPSFREVLRRVRKMTLGAYNHQDLPFEKLVEELRPERALSHGPLFQVSFVLQNTRTEIFRLGETAVTALEVPYKTSKDDLTLFCWETGEGLQGKLEYSTDLFDDATIDELIKVFQTLLKGIVADPDQPISKLPLLDETEKERLLAQSSCVLKTDSKEKCIHHLFEERAAQDDAACALISAGQTLSYGELNRRANQLARYLQKQGVGPEVLVGIYLPRSIEMVVGLLGVLKAGGAYLPLDPKYSGERTTNIIEDAGLRYVLTDKMTGAGLATPGINRICVDTHDADISVESEADVASNVTPENLAYVIYTSGSTGIPKGVMITHRSLAAFTEAVREAYQLNKHDRVLQFASISFDTAAEEIYPCLSSGGSLMLRTDEMLNSVHYFLQQCDEWKITVLDLPTAYWHQLAAEAGKPGWQLPESLRLVIIGGEHALPEYVSSWRNNVGYYPELINTYGPTEATVVATLHRMSRHDATNPDRRELPIGRPLRYVQAYILDRHLQITPHSFPGELYIGGAALARGYLKRPGQTTEKFIAHPHSTEPGARLYQTGDWVRRLPDGKIVFLGRVDNQVKIRGYRVELNEIESALAEHPLVKEAVVVAKESTAGTKQLAAYVVTESPTRNAGVEAEAVVLRTEQVRQWREVFADSYQQSPGHDDSRFNIVGWNSSYTRLPIPVEEMSEWVEQTVTGIQSLGPKSLLEIGCGTGLILFRLAPACSSYVGTDFSAEALAYIQPHLEAQGLSMVKLLEQEADDFAGIAEGEHDTIVINSVIQYFPNINYLLRVLRGACRLVKPGGNIFIGDIRDLSFLEAFYTSVELYQAEDSVSTALLQSRIRKRIAQEEELLVDPAFFYALKREIPAIGDVRVLLKRGKHHNEMTKFRYDVVLRMSPESVASARQQLTLDWEKDKLTLSELRSVIERAHEAHRLRIVNVKNLRIEPDFKAVELLATDGHFQTAGQLKEQLRLAPLDGLDPEVFWKLAEELGWHANIVSALSGSADRFDVILSKEGRATFSAAAAGHRESLRPWHQYANDPLHSKFTRQLLPGLRAFIARKLPDYMQPSGYKFLDSLPLTAQGKVDRQALPLPDQSRSVVGDFVAPRTPTEEALAKIWQTVLEIDLVGVNDNFFELGGHSLLATQVISRARELFGVELTVRVLFERLTVAGLALSIENLRSAENIQSGNLLQPITRNQPLSLSFAQERFWFMEQMQENSAAYNISCVLQLTGKLHIAALEASLAEIIRRHEVLRTVFPTVDGRPIQVINSPGAPPFDVIDLRTLSSNQRTEEMQRLVNQMASKPFDLSEGPLIRLLLIRLAERENVFLLTMHHIISDGWSVGILMKELSLLYEAFAGGKASPLPELPIQYADFASWHRALLSAVNMEEQVNYWKRQLEGAPPLLELPTDYPRPARQRFRGASLSFALPYRLYGELSAVSQREGCTLFMTLLAAFQTLLYRYTGQKDIVVCTGIANRNHPRLENLIGCFINILVLRTRMSGAPGFIELLRRVREVTLQAYGHQELPFEQLTKALNQQRELSYHPIAQVMFILQNSPAQSLNLPGLTSTPIKIKGETSQLDLNLQMWETVGGLEGYISYNTDLFEEASIARMLDCFQTLLEGIVANPEQSVSSLPLLHKSEQQKILCDWNATETPFEADKCLHQLFEAHALREPDAIAVYYEQEQITYGELNARANQLAHYLRRRGVGPESIVGICLECSVNMLVAILGILKAGGAYLSLDPAYPKARLAFMLEDAGAQLIVTRQKMVSTLPFTEADLVCLDEERRDIANGSPENPDSGVGPDNLAYVIYTSGSTGKPKGIAINHLGVVNNVTDLNRRYKVGPLDSVLVLSSLSFDMSVYETLGMLAAGGALVVPSEEAAKDPALWAGLIKQFAVTVWNSAPALLTLLVDYTRSRPELWPVSLRLALLGGDWIPATLPGQLRELAGEIEVVCMGGATEASIHSILYQAEGDESLRKKIPYGKPMANQRAFILDEQLQPLPPGVPGDLYLGGIGLARGYYNRPDLTAMKFLPAPFDGMLGERIYQTGDRAFYLPDGNIELIGRIDYQVKLRGLRIELEEITALLKAHESVSEGLVLMAGDPLNNSSQRLVAFVIPLPASTPESEVLRRFLKERLPEYMVPSVYVMIDAFPLSPNGKVDRLKLLELSAGLGELAGKESFVAPRSLLEEVIALIWVEVLGVSRLGIHANFFVSGGHSLAAMRVVSRLREIFPIAIALPLIFQAPTVAQLAAALETQGRAMQVDVEKIAQIFLHIQTLAEDEIAEQLVEDTREKEYQTNE